MSNVKTAYERVSYKIRWVFSVKVCQEVERLYGFLIFSLSESPWSEYSLCPSWVNVLISPHVSTPVQPFIMQPCRGKRPFDCPIAGNAPLSRVLYPFPIQFLTTFLGCKVSHSYYLAIRSFQGCQDLQTNATTRGRVESSMPIFDSILLGEFDYIVSFLIY